MGNSPGQASTDHIMGKEPWRETANRPQGSRGMGRRGGLPPRGPRQPHPRGGWWVRGEKPTYLPPLRRWPLSTGKMVTIRSPKAGEGPGWGLADGGEEGVAPFHPDKHSSENSRISR